MIIECPFCNTRVDGKLIAEDIQTDDGESQFDPFKVILLECPACKSALVANQIYEGYGLEEGWSKPSRVWPSGESQNEWLIPKIVGISLEEAKKCFGNGAYIACAVMCGRTLEGICKHYNTKSQYLAKGLDELLERKIIDSQLYEWGSELRNQRNLGAHATQEKISKVDARDLLDFTNAICDYVFVLTHKFQVFMDRKKGTALPLPPPPHNQE